MQSYKVNISIDDVSPHPLSSTKVLDRCYELIDIFPDIKFTLFVPISYWRTVRKEVSTKHPLQIDLYEEFCNEIKSLSDKNFEIGYHGLYHGVPGVTDNDEFRDISYDEAMQKFIIMFKITKNCGLSRTFKPIFRPPAWRMSKGAFDACRELGIEILGLYDADPTELKKYNDEDTKFDKVIYANVMPPIHPLKLHEKTEIVYHACEWDKNFLNVHKTNNLKEF